MTALATLARELNGSCHQGGTFSNFVCLFWRFRLQLSSAAQCHTWSYPVIACHT